MKLYMLFFLVTIVLFGQNSGQSLSHQEQWFIYNAMVRVEQVGDFYSIGLPANSGWIEEGGTVPRRVILLILNEFEKKYNVSVLTPYSIDRDQVTYSGRYGYRHPGVIRAIFVKAVPKPVAKKK